MRQEISIIVIQKLIWFFKFINANDIISLGKCTEDSRQWCGRTRSLTQADGAAISVTVTVTVALGTRIVVNPERSLVSLTVDALVLVGIVVGEAALAVMEYRLVTRGGAAVPVPSSKTSNCVANWLCTALWLMGTESSNSISGEALPPWEISISTQAVYASNAVLSMFGHRLQSQTQ